MFEKFIKKKNKIKKAVTAKFKGKNKKVLVESFAEFEQISLNDLKQTVLIRGKSTKNPLLIFLHGGPGCSEMGLFNHFNKKLENNFIVVNWDQRGTCKSFYNGTLAKETITIKNLVDDLHKLTLYVTKKFKKKKVYLIGHSFGTILGLLFTHKYPELVHSYVGVAPFLDPKRAERIVYNFLLTAAIDQENKKAIKELKNIKDIPNNSEEYLDKVTVFRRWVHKFGGSLYGESNLSKLSRALVRSKEYSFRELMNYEKSNLFSMKCLWKEMVNINMFNLIKEIKVPVYFAVGRHDYQTPSLIAKEYLEKLQAPKKELIWFEKSAHNPMYEEPDKFNKLMIRIKK